MKTSGQLSIDPLPNRGASSIDKKRSSVRNYYDYLILVYIDKLHRNGLFVGEIMIIKD